MQFDKIPQCQYVHYIQNLIEFNVLHFDLDNSNKSFSKKKWTNLYLATRTRILRAAACRSLIYLWSYKSYKTTSEKYTETKYRFRLRVAISSLFSSFEYRFRVAISRFEFRFRVFLSSFDFESRFLVLISIFYFEIRISSFDFEFWFRVLISSFDFKVLISSFDFEFRVLISSFDFEFGFRDWISRFQFRFRDSNFEIRISRFEFRFRVSISSFDFEFRFIGASFSKSPLHYSYFGNS